MYKVRVYCGSCNALLYESKEFPLDVIKRDWNDIVLTAPMELSCDTCVGAVKEQLGKISKEEYAERLIKAKFNIVYNIYDVDNDVEYDPSVLQNNVEDIDYIFKELSTMSIKDVEGVMDELRKKHGKVEK